MSEKKDNWERLISIPDEYEYDPEIAQRAIEQIEREKAEKQAKKAWWKKQWKPMAISLASCAVALAVFIPVYHSFFQSQWEAPPDSGSGNSSTIYYDDNDITFTIITDVSTYVQEHSLTLKYFNYQTAITHAAVITDTNQFAYIEQEMLYIGADGFDQVNLWSVVMTDADFDFERFFDGFVEEVITLNISVTYKVKEEIDSPNKDIRAKFTYESVDYYLELTTAGEVEAKIEQYVNMLIS